MINHVCLLSVVGLFSMEVKEGVQHFAMLNGGQKVPVTESQYIALLDYLTAKNEQELNHVMADFEGLDDLIAQVGGTD